MSYSGTGLQWDVRPSCVLQGGFNGAINNEVKPIIRIFISSHTASSTLGLETILLTPGPTMRKYSAFVPSRLTIPLLARCWFEISKKEKAVAYFVEILNLLTSFLRVRSTLHFASWETCSCVIWWNRWCQVTGTGIFLMAFKTSIVCPYPRIRPRTEGSGTLLHCWGNRHTESNNNNDATRTTTATTIFCWQRVETWFVKLCWNEELKMCPKLEKMEWTRAG